MWPFTKRSHRTPIFPFGPYRLDQHLGDSPDLTELSPEEYRVRPLTFGGERIVKAPPIRFAGHEWQVKLGIVNGVIYKIVVYQELQDREQATRVASDALTHCTQEFGKPDEQRTGFFIWRAAAGNVILQTADAADGYGVNLFATSRAVRTFAPL